MPKLLNLGGWESVAIATPGLRRLAPWRTVRGRIEAADRLLYAEIAERRADPDLAMRTDALAMLIRAADGDREMTDVELRDQLMTLLVAGHDTTATALSWALGRLTRHPGILAKAVSAARSQDADGDEYLDAVARETLRIRPVVFDVGRVLTEATDIAGYRLPAGVMVAPGIGLVHTSAQQYPEPDRFNPDRMLGATLSPTTWLPFGGGNRRCLGATFALVEMKVVLREVLRRVDLATTTAAERQRVKARHPGAPPRRPDPRAGDPRRRADDGDVPCGAPRLITGLITRSTPAGTCLPADRGPGRRSSRTRTGAPRRSHRRPHRRECHG
jgi:cytochrome P450 family 135